eukprot:CAMPEP_0197530716 /NCGR_PEP_ID=MMETSP1318-20131121/32712_1 /TAXON_ID=552666 /ORGANISM="Partenskyella glossopodia, Strain RCC365" /LENGTH=357 /DNA_ID=CAMNT_0043086657 /DNA_START=345 /DNA_END=1418 /DNA_ORIENTATION=+
MSILHDSVNKEEKEGKKNQDGDPPPPSDPNQNRQSVSKTAPKSTISSRKFPPRPNAEIPTFEFKNKFPSKSNSDAPPPPTHPASSPGSRRSRNYRSPSPPAAEFSGVARTSTPRPQTPAIGMRSPSRSLRTAEGKGKGPHFDSKQPQAQAQAQPQFQPASRDRYSGLAAGDSSVASRERSGKSVYAAWKVFKGKGAVNAVVKPPVWEGSLGDSGGSMRLEKEGALLLEFANSVSQRVYDWQTKSTFKISVVEMGSILAMKEGEILEFFHDPNKGKSFSTQDKVSKILRIQPASSSGSSRDIFLSLDTRQSSGSNSRVSIPLTPGEFAVLKEVIRFTIPRALGFDRVHDVAFDSFISK